MTLDGYEKLVESAEAAPVSEGVYVNAGLLRLQLERALWANEAAKGRAVALVERLRKVEDRSAVAAGVVGEG